MIDLSREYYKKNIKIDMFDMIQLKESEIRVMLDDLELKTIYECLQKFDIDVDIVKKQQKTIIRLAILFFITFGCLIAKILL